MGVGVIDEKLYFSWLVVYFGDVNWTLSSDRILHCPLIKENWVRIRTQSVLSQILFPEEEVRTVSTLFRVHRRRWFPNKRDQVPLLSVKTVKGKRKREGSRWWWGRWWLGSVTWFYWCKILLLLLEFPRVSGRIKVRRSPNINSLGVGVFLTLIDESLKSL